MHKLTTQEFIEKAEIIHGSQYDYSKVRYENMSTEIQIRCPKHGIFLQKPSNHLRGHGCPACGRSLNGLDHRLTQEQFLLKAHNVHGNKYDYSEVNYTTNTTPIKIKCPAHGNFTQTPAIHLRGGECPVCGKVSMANKHRKTREKFIEEALGVHGETYDYSRVEYKNLETKVEIICPEHGSFFQSPSNHLAGRGCPKCGYLSMNTETFITKAKSIHGDKYDYSHTKFDGANHKIIVECKKHGNFEILPYLHLKGCGCQKCSNEEKSNVKIKLWEKKRNELHYADSLLGQFPDICREFDYTKNAILKTNPRYLHPASSIEQWWICPNGHSYLMSIGERTKKNRGCPLCSQSSGEQAIRRVLEYQNIKFKCEYRFADCKDVLPLRFDFMILRNLVPIGEIEFHGEQHYHPISFTGNQTKSEVLEDFNKRQKHDDQKTKYLQSIGVPQLIISYTEQKNIQELVLQFLNTIQRKLENEQE